MALRSKDDYIQSIADLQPRDLPVRREGRRLRQPPHDPALAQLRRHDLRAGGQARVRRPDDRHQPPHRQEGQPLHPHPPALDDLVKKVKMQRLLGQKTGSCFQRCVGMDAINALWSVTCEMDQARGTDYHERFRDYVQLLQDDDMVADGAMTDVKGDRALAPHQQADPDLYLHIVERRDDGIVVRGAKAHQTGACNSHEILVMPTIAMREGDEDYAVSLHARRPTRPASSTSTVASPATPASSKRNELDVGNPQFGGHEALMVFDNVFVPWERVFMCRRDRVLRRPGRALRRLPPPELRRLQGRRGRRADRRRRAGRRHTTARPRRATSRTSSSR